MRNTSILMPKGPSAPVYERRRWHQNPEVRIPSRAALAQIPNGPPFWITILDTATLSPDGDLDPGASLENTFQFTTDFWWVLAMSSFNVVNVTTAPFTFSLYRTWVDAGGNDYSATFQKSPIVQGVLFGSSSNPFELDEPILFRKGEQIQCRVQSSYSLAQALQIVLFGYLGQVSA